MITRRMSFRLVRFRVGIWPFKGKFLAPKWLLCTFPRNDPGNSEEDNALWLDFQSEMKRTRALVTRIPESNSDRRLEHSTQRLSQANRDEFRRLGNLLLVRYNKFWILNLTFLFNRIGHPISIDFWVDKFDLPVILYKWPGWINSQCPFLRRKTVCSSVIANTAITATIM